MPTQISALPVVVPLAVLALVVLLGCLRRHSALTLPRIAVAVVLCVHGAGVVANTVFPVTIGRGASDLPWTVFPDLVPLAGTEPFDMLRNVVVFVPLGMLLPLVTRVRSIGRVLLTGFLVSLAMELLQLGRTFFVAPESARSQLRDDVVAVPVVDAPPVATVIAWPPHSRSLAVAGLVQTALRL